MAKGERFIFIGGAERSGTTLVQNILDSHPDIFGGPEFRHIQDIVYLRNKLHETIKLKKIHDYCSCDEVDRYIYTLIESLLLPLADEYKCKYLSEKTPWNIFVFSELKSLCPRSHFIRVIRDPRAVIASEIRVRERRSEKKIQSNYNGSLSDFRRIIAKVKKPYLSGNASTKISPERELIVVYEKLVTDIEGETKRICRFLEIPWSEKMIYPSRIKHLGEETMTRIGVHYSKESFNRDPETTSIDKWKKKFTRIQKALISIHFRDMGELTQYGYYLNDDSFSQKVLIDIISSIRKLNTTRIGRKFLKRFLK